MNICELQQEIIRMKKENDVCILAHSYQAKEIVEVADFTGDSFQLSLMATKASNKNVVMCGVRFMAETVKLLSPEKKVYLANPTAGCPMAEQMDKDLISQIHAMEPDRTVVAYINTTASLKTVCDVCVTSSSALRIVRALDNDKILFIPDCNLGSWVQAQCPEKDIKLLSGGCPTHAALTVAEVKKAKEEHPNALFLVHPECVPAVTALADYAGSTSGIMDFARKSDAKEFIIGTEHSIVQHLQFECPDKTFYALSSDLICQNMKMTTLGDVYRSCLGTGGDEILMSDELIAAARKPIDRMIELGG